MPDDQGSNYTVTTNDCMSSIAAKFGFFWKTLWMHPQNQQLRQVRKNPNVLRENDRVWIPPKQVRQELKPTDGTHTFVMKGIPTLFRMRFLDSGTPRSNVPYVLTIDGRLFDGSTDEDGKLEVRVPPNARQGTLVLGQGKEAKTFNLNLGLLDPVSEPKGAANRLQSLGYHCGLDPTVGLPNALAAFQADNYLQRTGDLDPATQSKLAEVFGA